MGALIRDLVLTLLICLNIHLRIAHCVSFIAASARLFTDYKLWVNSCVEEMNKDVWLTVFCIISKV